MYNISAGLKDRDSVLNMYQVSPNNYWQLYGSISPRNNEQPIFQSPMTVDLSKDAGYEALKSALSMLSDGYGTIKIKPSPTSTAAQKASFKVSKANKVNGIGSVVQSNVMNDQLYDLKLQLVQMQHEIEKEKIKDQVLALEAKLHEDKSGLVKGLGTLATMIGNNEEMQNGLASLLAKTIGALGLRPQIAGFLSNGVHSKIVRTSIENENTHTNTTIPNKMPNQETPNNETEKEITDAKDVEKAYEKLNKQLTQLSSMFETDAFTLIDKITTSLENKPSNVVLVKQFLGL